MVLAAVIAADCALAETLPLIDRDAATAARFDALRAEPARLRLFLQAMPKGGDLHNHLWGTPYAEDFLAWAAEDGMCVSREKLEIAPAPCTGVDKVAARDLGVSDPALYSALVDSLSTRGRDGGLTLNDISGHDRFFATFDRFAPVAIGSIGRMVAKARETAAGDRVSYLELIHNPSAMHTLASRAAEKPFDPDDFEAAFRRIANDIPALVAEARAETDKAETEVRRLLDCDRAADAPACAVEVRYLPFALRSQSPGYVFGQMALAFALVEADPRYVGVNIVAPEDGPVALADYSLHMRMFAFFGRRHPGVAKSLHAGELSLGLVPPAELKFHIREAIEVGGARRIGHGIDIAYEDDAPTLLARMKRDRIAVEINLTSNDTILGVKGAAHPLSLYRAAGVPVMLSTDDEGVSRSDMTNEYLRAATEQKLGYRDLKAMARASLEYAFLPGASLWADGVVGGRAGACATLEPKSAKAKAQCRLEEEFRAFEGTIGALVF